MHCRYIHAAALFCSAAGNAFSRLRSSIKSMRKESNMFNSQTHFSLHRTPQAVQAVALAVFLALNLIISTVPVQAASLSPYQAKTAPSLGNAFVGITGEYETVSIDGLLQQINDMRKEACDLGYTTKYRPIKWSTALEKVARIRVAEYAAYEQNEHDRPNGEPTTAIKCDGINSTAEALSWTSFRIDGMTNASYGVKRWYMEKKF